MTNKRKATENIPQQPLKRSGTDLLFQKMQSSLPKPPTIVGEVFVMGSGECGQLGLGPDEVERLRPAKIKVLAEKNITDIVAGGMSTFAISNQDNVQTIYSWGCNDQGCLSRGNEETEVFPVEGLENIHIVEVAAGDSITAVLSDKGLVYACGTYRANNGIFGFNTASKEQRKFVLVEGIKNVISIAAGANHIAAITVNGKLYTWGVGEHGELGRKIMERHKVGSSLIPRAINFSRAKKFVKVYAGGYHTFAVTSNNEVYSFGLNNYGQLGLGDEISREQPEEVELPEGFVIKDIGVGEHHTIILGEAYAFGRNDSYQLGLGDNQPHNTPTLAPELKNLVSISCGSAFSLGVTKDGDFMAWGYGECGQLGNSGVDEEKPKIIDLKGRKVIKAEAGGQHSVLLLHPRQ
ncbi:RCC1/BLIP-II protein [Neocallimastix sp. 'constans']